MISEAEFEINDHLVVSTFYNICSKINWTFARAHRNRTSCPTCSFLRGAGVRCIEEDRRAISELERVRSSSCFPTRLSTAKETSGQYSRVVLGRSRTEISVIQINSFIQCLQIISGVVPKNRPRPLFPCIFQFIILHIIRRASEV